MQSILPGMKRIAMLISLLVVFLSCQKDEELSAPVIKIGVMLPYTGEYASDWSHGLDWAVENINLAGGIAGHRLELVKRDINKESLSGVATAFINDETIKAVIGPLTSTHVYEVAPLFIKAKKVLLAPIATSANISKAFSGYGYFWRLTEPDISQMKTLILLAQKEGAQKISLLTEESQYGASFEDWFGFFATEMALDISDVEVVNPGDLTGTRVAWNRLAANHPDAVISAINLPSQNIELVKAYRENGQQIRLLMSDAAALHSLIDQLGPAAENLEGTTISSFPNSGFDISYHVRYQKYPAPFLSQMYDAVMLLAYALEASRGNGGEELKSAMEKVVSGRDGSYQWQRDEVKRVLQAIKSGVFPDINGASGALDFDDLYYTDVTSTTYGHWRVDAGQYVITNFYTSDGAGRITSTSAAYRIVADKTQVFSDSIALPPLLPKKKLYALLIAHSKGWENYRHQADVLQMYQLLKKNGLPDDQIILIVADDIAQSLSNPHKGLVKNRLDGENLYHNIEIDYKLTDISSDDLRNILSGVSTTTTPVVLTSSITDNLFMFTSGHGTPDGMSFAGLGDHSLTPEYWNTTFQNMQANGRFRQLFWALDNCYSGCIGEKITTPRVMLMTGANPYETSKAFIYDTELSTWLADKFAYSINNAVETNPDFTFYELYQRSFSFVNGSHVSFYNYRNFGNIYSLRLHEFVQP